MNKNILEEIAQKDYSNMCEKIHNYFMYGENEIHSQGFINGYNFCKDGTLEQGETSEMIEENKLLKKMLYEIDNLKHSDMEDYGIAVMEYLDSAGRSLWSKD
ncbi:MAG: hypothetical protein MJ176_03250 [Treponema sp.]|nr:hypothetical protein [Treponema sp.]